MCLGVVAKITKVIDKSFVLADFGGVVRKISILLLETEAEVGDYIMVHAGAAIQKLSKKDALARLAFLKEYNVIE